VFKAAFVSTYGAVFFMKNLRIGKKRFSVPERFEEIPKHAIREMCIALLKGNRILTFCAVAQVPIALAIKVSAEQWLSLLPAIDWLKTQSTDKAPLAFIELKGVKYFLPADGMEFSPFIEFVMAEDALWRYLKQDEEKALSEFFFTLCRPENPQPKDAFYSGDRRERYNSALIQERSKTVAVPNWCSFLLILFFSGVKEYLKEIYPEMFPQKTEKKGEAIALQDESPAVGWLKLIKVLADNGTYGTYEMVCYTFMHTIMLNTSFDLSKNDIQGISTDVDFDSEVH
jgi:hypothetical protein